MIEGFLEGGFVFETLSNVKWYDVMWRHGVRYRQGVGVGFCV